MENLLSTILIVIAILIVVLLLLREVNCWYWKINQRISLMEKQNKLLEKLVSNNVHLEKSDTKIENITEQPIKNIHNDYTPETISKDRRAHSTKKEIKKRKFNYYWIYGIFVLFLLGIYLINFSGKTKKTDWKGLQQMLIDKDVRKIELVNKDVAYIYIKPNKLKNAKYKDLPKAFMARKSEPQYTFSVTSPDIFIQQVMNVQKDNQTPIYVESVTRHNWEANILSWILPIALLIIIGFLIFTNIPAFQKHKSK